MKKLITLFVVSTAFLVAPGILSAQKLVNQEFYENGKLQSSTYFDGKKYHVIQFFENGQIKEKCVYSSQKKDGVFESWYENGVKHVSIEYADNQPEAQWVVRNDSGQIIGSAKFDDGKLINASMWDDSGKLIAYR